MSQTGQGHSTISSTKALAGWTLLLRVIRNGHYLRTGGEKQLSKGPPYSAPPDDEAQTLTTQIEDKLEADSIREEVDKKRWARLRRVKSLFETKGGKRLGRSDTTKSKSSTS